MDEEMKNLEKSAEEAAVAAKIAAKETRDAKELVSTLEEQGAAELEKALEEIRKLKALEVEKVSFDFVNLHEKSFNDQFTVVKLYCLINVT